MMYYQWPFKGSFRFGTPYGVRGSMWACGWHSGLDLFSRSSGGDGKVYPVAPGVVERAGMDGAYGNSVRVRHPDGYISLYAHLANIAVKPGQAVTPDTILGIEGNTGNSTGIHLHLEIHRDKYHYPSSTDPKGFIEGRLEDKMTQDEFNSMMDNYLAAQRAKLVKDYHRDDWEGAVKAGIFDGTMPESPLTREQAATVFSRLGLIKQKEDKMA